MNLELLLCWKMGEKAELVLGSRLISSSSLKKMKYNFIQFYTYIVRVRFVRVSFNTLNAGSTKFYQGVKMTLKNLRAFTHYDCLWTSMKM